jgi:hypothetical protein
MNETFPKNVANILQKGVPRSSMIGALAGNTTQIISGRTLISFITLDRIWTSPAPLVLSTRPERHPQHLSAHLLDRSLRRDRAWYIAFDGKGSAH